MKIVLIQDEIHLPSLAGGTKANRCLLEGLARHGHQCVTLARALTRSPDGPNSLEQFADEMKTRGKVVHEIEPRLFSYEHNGVQVEALNLAGLDERRDCLVRRIQAINPDWVFVTDDKRRFMLKAAMQAAPNRVILLLQTIVQLPFGPISIDPSPEYTDLIKSARALFVISNFTKQYIHDHSGLNAHLLRIPVYGEGPFRDLACFDRGFVTMINPCELKGVSLFIDLAQAFPNVPFAAVPTWGADPEVIARLRALPNVQLLDSVDDIEEILGQTRILLVPSLWPETFGYVVPEAMLRGIPVLASNVGGLPEAKLGVDYLLPVVPGEFGEKGFVSPPQDVGPWSTALGTLLSDRDAYDRCSRHSRQAAHDFVSSVSVSPFEALMIQLTDGQSRSGIRPEFN